MGLWRVRGGVRFVEWTSHGTPALPRSTLMFLRADCSCCGGYTASASRFGGAALLAGLSTCMMWRGRRGRAGPGPWLVLARVFRVECYFLVAACWGFALRYDMWAARSPLEEPVYRCAGRSRRRVRGDGVLVWSGVALPCLCGGSRRQVSSFSRGRATPSCCAFMFSLSACVRNVVCVYEQTNMVVTNTTT